MFWDSLSKMVCVSSIIPSAPSDKLVGRKLLEPATSLVLSRGGVISQILIPKKGSRSLVHNAISGIKLTDNLLRKSRNNLKCGQQAKHLS